MQQGEINGHFFQNELHALTFFLSPISSCNSAGNNPFSQRAETNQLHADLPGCCVRRELERRRSDRKHGKSWSLDLPPELAAAMLQHTHPSSKQKTEPNQPTCHFP